MIKNITGSTIGDLESVSYFSDGKTLNATFWLTSPISKKPPLTVTFSPTHTSIPVDGFTTANLKIKALDTATPRAYTLPIAAHISYPSEYFGNPSADILENSNVTATILPRLTPSEQLSIFMQEWFNPLSGIVTTLCSIGSGLVGWVIGNKRK